MHFIQEKHYRFKKVSILCKKVSISCKIQKICLEFKIIQKKQILILKKPLEFWYYKQNKILTVFNSKLTE